MGVTRDGRFAALTNHRDPAGVRESARSRGLLVGDYLLGQVGATEYAAKVARARTEYNGFNFLASDRDALWYAGNHADAPVQVPRGIHALSNARLNTPWPKAVGLAKALSALLPLDAEEDLLVDELQRALGESAAPPDHMLPETGVGLERERQLAPRKIIAPIYGTRSSSVLIMRADGSARFDEISFDPSGASVARVSQVITA